MAHRLPLPGSAIARAPLRQLCVVRCYRDGYRPINPHLDRILVSILGLSSWMPTAVHVARLFICQVRPSLPLNPR